jgi:hypothetical protein
MRQLPYASVSLPERQRAEAATGTESPEREREWWWWRKYFNGIKVARF